MTMTLGPPFADAVIFRALHAWLLNVRAPGTETAREAERGIDRQTQ